MNISKKEHRALLDQSFRKGYEAGLKQARFMKTAEAKSDLLRDEADPDAKTDAQSADQRLYALARAEMTELVQGWFGKAQVEACDRSIHLAAQNIAQGYIRPHDHTRHMEPDPRAHTNSISVAPNMPPALSVSDDGNVVNYNGKNFLRQDEWNARKLAERQGAEEATHWRERALKAETAAHDLQGRATRAEEAMTNAVDRVAELQDSLDDKRAELVRVEEQFDIARDKSAGRLEVIEGLAKSLADRDAQDRDRRIAELEAAQANPAKKSLVDQMRELADQPSYEDLKRQIDEQALTIKGYQDAISWAFEGRENPMPLPNATAYLNTRNAELREARRGVQNVFAAIHHLAFGGWVMSGAEDIGQFQSVGHVVKVKDLHTALEGLRDDTTHVPDKNDPK
jgi:hypothetical protein